MDLSARGYEDVDCIELVMLLFWVVTACELVGRYQRFGGTYCPTQPERWRQYVSPKRWYLSTSSQAVTIQKTNIDVFTAVRTSDLIFSQPVFERSIVMSSSCLRLIFQLFSSHDVLQQTLC
jgi:hypothetical protein